MTARRARSRRRDRRNGFWKAFWAAPSTGSAISSKAYQHAHPEWADVRIRRHIMVFDFSPPPMIVDFGLPVGSIPPWP